MQRDPISSDATTGSSSTTLLSQPSARLTTISPSLPLLLLPITHAMHLLLPTTLLLLLPLASAAALTSLTSSSTSSVSSVSSLSTTTTTTTNTKPTTKTVTVTCLIGFFFGTSARDSSWS